MHSNDHLTQLASALEIQELEWSADGTCAITLDDIAVQFERKSDTCTLLTGVVGQLPPMPSSELLEEILSANMFLMSHGLAFTFEPESRHILLQGRVESDVVQLNIEKVCESFVAAVEHNQQVLREYEASEAEGVPIDQTFVRG